MSRHRGGEGPHPPGLRSKGVLSIPDDEAVNRWVELPAGDRLRWLAEANEFLYRAQPEEVRRLWHELRRAEW